MSVEHNPKIDNIEDVEAKIAEIVLDRRRQFAGGESRQPHPLLITPGTDLGDITRSSG